jgi:hypothetical protein
MDGDVEGGGCVWRVNGVLYQSSACKLPGVIVYCKLLYSVFLIPPELVMGLSRAGSSFELEL